MKSTQGKICRQDNIINPAALFDTVEQAEKLFIFPCTGIIDRNNGKLVFAFDKPVNQRTGVRIYCKFGIRSIQGCSLPGMGVFRS